MVGATDSNRIPASGSEEIHTRTYPKDPTLVHTTTRADRERLELSCRPKTTGVTIRGIANYATCHHYFVVRLVVMIIDLYSYLRDGQARTKLFYSTTRILVAPEGVEPSQNPGLQPGALPTEL